jgi:PAS domain S-box-containing protein
MSKPKVLLVDDDEIILHQLTATLSEFVELHLATTGQTALALARDIHPNLILLDLGLPDIDGYDILHVIKDDESLSRIPVVVITSRAKSLAHDQSMAIGAAGFVAKPLDNEVIKSLIERLLSVVEDEPDEVSSTGERFKNLVNMLSEAVVISDMNGTILLVNQFCLNLFGYTKEELIGKNVNILTPPDIASKHDAYIETYKKTHQANLIGNPRELTAITKSGNELFIELNLSEFTEHGESHYLAVIRDITERKMTQAKLLKAAIYDPLTGLNTNVALTLDLEKLTSTEITDGYLYSLLLDIDDFQSLNAVMGADICDELLKSVAKVLMHVSLPLNCRVYRLMSDRFLITGFNEDKSHAEAQKESLIKALNTEMDKLYDSLDYPVVATSVCLLSSLASTEPQDLKHQLEIILNSARSKGNNGLTTRASEHSYQSGLEFAALKLGLQTAVDFSRLSIVLQPKVDKHHNISSFEALLRWNNAGYTLLHLGDYIEAAEITSTIIDVGYFVIKKVCHFLCSVPVNKRKRIFINLSIRQISAPNFIENVKSICLENKIDTKFIGFEITESMASEDMNFIKDRLFDLKSLGHSIAIDDFGTGQSNLRYIHKLPLSELKIDKSFIDDVDNASGHYPLVEGVFHLAKSMNLKVVAEGVETENQVTYLNKLGVDEIQGYYFYKPQPLDVCYQLLDDAALKEEATQS